MTIIYRDDLIQKPLLELINRCISDEKFHWQSPTSGYSTVSNEYPTKDVLDIDLKVIDSPQMVHPLLIGGQIYSSWFHIFENLLTDVIGKAFPKSDADWLIGRAKLNNTFRCHFSDGTYYNPPHVDPYLEEVYENGDFGDKDKQINMLIYFGDSDGDTFFFEGNEIRKEQHVLTRVSPKNGRVVLFNREQLHASSPPIKSQNRFVLNVNFLTSVPLDELYKYIEEEDKP